MAWLGSNVETRSQSIERVTRIYFRETGVSQETFALTLMENYFERVHEVHRSIKFHCQGDTYKDMRSNSKMVERFMNGTMRMPCDLEEAWVDALPDPYHSRLKSELADRYGLLAVEIPDAERGSKDVAALFRECGEAGEVLSRMLVSNGSIGLEDAPFARHAVEQLTDVVTVAMSLIHQVRENCIGADCPAPDLKVVR